MVGFDATGLQMPGLANSASNTNETFLTIERLTIAVPTLG
jgi:hypothetical protein